VGIQASFLSSDFTLNDFIARNLAEEKQARYFAQGFIPIDYSESEMEYYPIVSAKIFLGIAGVCLERTIDALFPLGPVRNSPERWYIYCGVGKENVGSRGEYLTDLLFRDPELVKEANQWLKRLDIGYQVKVVPLGPRYKDLLEVILVDTRNKKGVEVNLSDVGFGISQILPFIIQSLAGSEQIITIEQPEIHIHPRLQADLGDLIAHTIKAPYNNQFLIETHSEHLVLRIQRLIRKKKLKPEDVSVLFVSRGREGSNVQQLRLDEDGDFIDEWPGGFFPERLRELR